jgi:hypothetical protein
MKDERKQPIDHLLPSPVRGRLTVPDVGATSKCFIDKLVHYLSYGTICNPRIAFIADLSLTGGSSFRGSGRSHLLAQVSDKPNLFMQTKFLLGMSQIYFHVQLPYPNRTRRAFSAISRIES